MLLLNILLSTCFYVLVKPRRKAGGLRNSTSFCLLMLIMGLCKLCRQRVLVGQCTCWLSPSSALLLAAVSARPQRCWATLITGVPDVFSPVKIDHHKFYGSINARRPGNPGRCRTRTGPVDENCNLEQNLESCSLVLTCSVRARTGAVPSD